MFSEIWNKYWQIPQGLLAMKKLTCSPLALILCSPTLLKGFRWYGNVKMFFLDIVNLYYCSLSLGVSELLVTLLVFVLSQE